MSYQKRNCNQDPEWTGEAEENEKIRRFLIVGALSLNKVPYVHNQVTKKLGDEILPKGRYSMGLCFFETPNPEKWLNNFPDMIIVVWRHQDLEEVSKFFAKLAEVKTTNPEYKPKVILWEIVPPDGKIPPMFHEHVPTLHYADAVQADMWLNRSQRNHLN